MKDALKLAKQAGYCDWNGQTAEMNDVGLEAFYNAAYNAGLEDAARIPYGVGDEGCYQQIMELKK